MIPTTRTLQTLKTLKELQKSEGLEDIETTKGFHTTSGLFINEDMFKYLGKTFKIKQIVRNRQLIILFIFESL